jgi:hypothetical protein
VRSQNWAIASIGKSIAAIVMSVLSPKLQVADSSVAIAVTLSGSIARSTLVLAISSSCLPDYPNK